MYLHVVMVMENLGYPDWEKQREQKLVLIDISLMGSQEGVAM